MNRLSLNRPRMATLATALIATLAAGLPALPARADSCATVEVDNVRPGQGFIMMAAYGSADTFGKTVMAQMRVPAGDSARQSIQLCGLSGAEVALTLYQDLDGDSKIGRNLLGMPTEPWGSSGTPGTFGPSWDTGKVALNGSAIPVKLSQ